MSMPSDRLAPQSCAPLLLPVTVTPAASCLLTSSCFLSHFISAFQCNTLLFLDFSVSESMRTFTSILEEENWLFYTPAQVHSHSLSVVFAIFLLNQNLLSS